MSLGWDGQMLGMLGQSRWSWLVVLGAFVAVSWIADSWARSSTSIGRQYAGLFLYVLAEAVIFLPMMAIAKLMTINPEGIGDVSIIAAAGVTTFIMFGALTAFSFLTKKD